VKRQNSEFHRAMSRKNTPKREYLMPTCSGELPSGSSSCSCTSAGTSRMLMTSSPVLISITPRRAWASLAAPATSMKPRTAGRERHHVSAPDKPGSTKRFMNNDLVSLHHTGKDGQRTGCPRGQVAIAAVLFVADNGSHVGRASSR